MFELYSRNETRWQVWCFSGLDPFLQKLKESDHHLFHWFSLWQLANRCLGHGLAMMESILNWWFIINTRTEPFFWKNIGNWSWVHLESRDCADNTIEGSAFSTSWREGTLGGWALPVVQVVRLLSMYFALFILIFVCHILYFVFWIWYLVLMVRLLVCSRSSTKEKIR